MGIAERKEREKEMRRQVILDAAERLFFSQGIDTTTMDEIAEEAEFSKGTLYLYFKNKEDMFHGIHLRGMEVLKSMFIRASSQQSRGIDKVRAIGESYFRFSQEESNYFKAMMMFDAHDLEMEDPESFACKCHHCAEEVMEIVELAVRAGIQDGSIRDNIDPKRTAYILWGQSSGVIQIISMEGEHLRQHHGVNPEELILDSFDFALHSLRP